MPYEHKDTYLKQASTGDIYPYHERLAKRSDMTPCNADGSDIGEEKPKARKPRAKKDEQTADINDDLDLGDE